MTHHHERGDDGSAPIAALVARLSNVFQHGTPPEIRAKTPSCPDLLAPLATFSSLRYGTLHALQHEPCARGAPSTGLIPIASYCLPSPDTVELFCPRPLGPVLGHLPPQHCYTSLLATSHWLTTFVEAEYWRRVRKGQLLSVPLRLGDTVRCLRSEGRRGRLGPSTRLRVAPADHEYLPHNNSEGLSGVTVASPLLSLAQAAGHGRSPIPPTTCLYFYVYVNGYFYGYFIS